MNYLVEKFLSIIELFGQIDVTDGKLKNDILKEIEQNQWLLGYKYNDKYLLHNYLSIGQYLVDIEIVELFLTDPNQVKYRDSEGIGCLFLSIEKNLSQEIIDLLIEYGAELSLLEKLYLSIEEEDLKKSISLYKQGGQHCIFNRKSQQIFGFNCFHLAIKNDFYDFVEYLIDSSFELNVATYDGRSAYSLLPVEGFCDEADQIRRKLVSKGVLELPIEKAINQIKSSGFTEKTLIENPSVINVIHPTLGSLLSNLALYGDQRSAEYLLKQGANPNIGTMNGSTPLHLAVGNIETLKLLVHFGALLNLQDARGNTPLHLAACESLESVEILLESGALVNVQNNKGETALDRVYKFKPEDKLDYNPKYWLEFVKVLKDHGAKKSTEMNLGL